MGDAPDRRVEILSDADSLHATWTHFGPGREGADLHIHRTHADFFYVLDGELEIRLGVEDHVVGVEPGKLVQVPPFVVHGFRNSPEADVHYLNFHAPGAGFADFMRGLRDGVTVPFDQEPPPEVGVRPIGEASIGAEEVLADGDGVRVALLADTDDVAFSEVDARAGLPAPPLHLHEHHSESFYVLEGELWFTADGQRFEAPRGSWVQIPPGVPHTFEAPGTAHFLNIHSPSCGYGDFLRKLTSGIDPAEARAAFDQIPAG